jgi:NAD(P)-dependent dehydrogenase (short-subunit alcohol dehydrogenase family)
MEKSAMRLKDKVALITASGSGMGRAAALTFAREGAKVVVADIDTTLGEETVSLIKKAGGNAAFIHTDVTRLSDLQKMIDFTMEKYGKLNILYNHAGIPGPVDLFKTEEEDWQKAIDVNLKSGFFATKFAVPAMRKSGGGSILFTSSVVAFKAVAKRPTYAMVKAGVVSLVKSFAMALVDDNIRVNAVCPGAIDTPMLDEFTYIGTPITDMEAAKKAFAAMMPMKRFGTAQEIANAALFLVSDEASFITGASLLVDGGRLVQ